MKSDGPRPHETQRSVAKADAWWRGAVIYQIYPRSFLDTNGDGVGDLQGCIKGLDHIASLGVDAVWLSPFFTSPMDDYGYDVADYRDVDPMFGTLADFKAFVEAAHARDIKVIIDQVYSHTSDQHSWFIESRASRNNPKADWYVWADPKPDGSPPNNWQSVFGGCSWEWDARRRQYYLHNFLTSQPDLNLHNKEVQDALLDVARFWLEFGVDGFRLDAINFAMHDPDFRDNPPARVFKKPPTRPFDFQEHRFNQSHPDIVGFLERVRDVTNAYDGAFTVAEIGGPNPLSEMKAFTLGDERLNSAYSFDYLYADSLNAELVRSSSLNWSEDDGWPSWAFSNHDAPRAVSRWAGDADPDDYSKFAAMLLLCLRGNVFLYQGEELGLPQADVPFEHLKDPEAIKNWPETLGRDGARTPLPWTRSAPNGGFSSGDPWLPVDQRHIDRAVDAQNADPASVLEFVRSMVAFRNATPSLRAGAITFYTAPQEILAFTRTNGDDELLCIFNLATTPVDWSPPDAADWRVVRSVNLDAKADGNKDLIPSQLSPASGYIARRAAS
ncbi:MAG: alpha-glucosidase [Pseudomonadota bacterium]